MQNNDYSIIRQVYGGGFTHISVARNRDGEQVVLRELREEFCNQRRIRNQFLSGGIIQARLNHPAIPKIIEINKRAPAPFMVLEYIHGLSLRKLLLTSAPILKEHPICIITRLAAAIQHVHLQGFLHLDIKPENVLITQDRGIHLIDFDLARKYHGKARKVKCISGTRAYIAPEIFLTRRVDERADIYSFGVTCFEILSGGHKPYERTSAEMRTDPTRRFSTKQQDLQLFCPTVNPRLRSIINKCVAKNPSIRYPSMHLVINDLNGLI
jgi:serine/threonine-protein kinase